MGHLLTYKAKGARMRFCIALSLFMVLFLHSLYAQPVCESRELSTNEIDSILTPTVRQNLGINYPIWKAYHCKDASGQFLIVLTESRDGGTEGVETLNTAIKAYKLLLNSNGMSKEWEMKDFLATKELRSARGEKRQEKEKNIWFWTKFCLFADVDKDGLIEPVIIYGTWGSMNYFDDGRVKILVYYKGKKHAIRHQNGVLDFERNTTVDASFYTLPKPILEKVQEIMEDIAKNNNAIFPYGWQAAMKKKEDYFDENSRTKKKK